MKRFFRLSLRQALLGVGFFCIGLAVFSALNRRWSVQVSPRVPIAISADGVRIAAGVSTLPIHVWKTQSDQRMVGLAGHTWFVPGLVFSNDDELISASYDGTLRYWDTETRRELRQINAKQGALCSLAISADAATLATGGSDGTTKLWNRETGAEIAHWTGHAAKVVRIAFSPEGQFLATMGADGRVRVFDTAKGLGVWELVGGGLGTHSDLAFSPDGKLAIANHADGKLQLRELPSGRMVGELEGPEFKNYSGVAFSPDGRNVALGHSRLISLHDWATKKRMLTFRAHEDWVTSLTFTPDGKTLVSSCSNNSVRSWNARTGELMQELRPSYDGFPWDVAGFGSFGFACWLGVWIAIARTRSSQAETTAPAQPAGK